MRTTINSQEAVWTDYIKGLFVRTIENNLEDGETISHANYFTPRPYRNEYDTGSNKEGFCFVLQPGNRVCIWDRVTTTEPARERELLDFVREYVAKSLVQEKGN